MNETPKELEKPQTAMFYSISATQKGLSQIELGNYLIKRVVRTLQSEFSSKTEDGETSLKEFCTLSPIPVIIKCSPIYYLRRVLEIGFVDI